MLVPTPLLQGRQYDCKLTLDLEYLASLLGRVPSLVLHQPRAGPGPALPLASLASLTRLHLKKV